MRKRYVQAPYLSPGFSDLRLKARNKGLIGFGQTGIVNI